MAIVARFFTLVILLAALDGTLPAQGASFDLVKVADNVYACIRKEPASLWFNANNVFIIGKKDVAVVDSNISTAYSREVIAALKKLTSKPVKYVINTHWHEDHFCGNQAYLDAYPKVQFVGHRSTLEDYPKIGAANRRGSLKGGPGFVTMLQDLLIQGKDFLGESITDEERAGYTSDAKLVESYLADAPVFKAILPTVLVDDRMELDLSGRKLEILHLGRAHTGGDLVVRLPQENIVVTGDLIVYPVPLVGSTSYPLEYGATLEKLLALKAKVMIPGHGPVMRDDAYLRLMIRLLDSIKQQVEAAVAKGVTLENTRKNIDLKEFVTAFAGDSPHKKFIFYNYVTEPAVTAAYGQAKR